MPRPCPPEFRQRAVELARLREKPIVELAGIWASPSRVCGTGWPKPDRDEGRTSEGARHAPPQGP